ncbi:MAG: photosystem II assembly protein, partial [Xenococcaceae cyanobacterium]
ELFFDFIVISHCFFYDRQQRKEAHHIYQKFFQDRLTPDGYILLIVQGRKLFGMYDTESSEDLDKERYVIDTFLDELGVKLEFYKYITSTGKRTPLEKNIFAKFARENLPKQKYMSELSKKYLEQKWMLNYKIDDYIILARL